MAKRTLLTLTIASLLATTAFVDPIHNAARNGQLQRTALLIATGADVNAKNDFGRTPLDNAIGRKLPEIADLIRKHGGKTGEELKPEAK